VIPLGSAAALLVALAVCVMWNAGLLALNLWSARGVRQARKAAAAESGTSTPA
jgi:hypothetical protein